MTVLFVISTIIFFLGLDWVVQRMKRQPVVESATRMRPEAASVHLRAPEGIFFAKSHTWLNLFPSGRLRLGVDDFIGSLMERPKITLLKRVGEQIQKGDPLLLLEDGEHRLTVRAPIAGEILSVNSELERDPDRMRAALFSDGWAYAIRPRALQELKDMFLGDESRTWMFEELRRLRELLTGTAAGELAPARIQDGGAPAASALKQMDAIRWQKLEDQFLQVR